jgi:hypothetical protein
VKSLAALALVFVAVTWASAAALAGSQADPILALKGGELGSQSTLVALDARTLRPEGAELRLPGWAFGVEWARAPAGPRIAIVPKPSESNEHLFVVTTQNGLHVLSRLALPGDVCRLAWASPDRLLAVVSSPACYQPIDSAQLLVIDPAAAHIVARRTLSGPATIIAATPARGGLALLLRPQARRNLRLLRVSAKRTRAFALAGISSPIRPLDKAVGSTIGLAIDAARHHAYVVEPDGRITDVDLANREVAVHVPRVRTTSAAAKGVAQAVVQALSPAPGVLVYSGVRRSSDGRLIPIGLRIVDTRSWRARVVDRNATGFVSAARMLMAYQPFVDQLGQEIPRIGLDLYSIDGRRLLHAFGNQQVEMISSQGRYAYASPIGGTSVLDLKTRHLDISVTDPYTDYELLAGPGSLAFPS